MPRFLKKFILSRFVDRETLCLAEDAISSQLNALETLRNRPADSRFAELMDAKRRIHRLVEGVS